MAYNNLYDGSAFISGYNAMTRTKYSFGALGATKYGAENKYGFSYTSQIALDINATAVTTRCVRDIRVD